ncbi:MAG TPA: alpha/beta hydrolase [Azospirillum sp.]
MTFEVLNRRMEHRWLLGRDATAPTLVFLHEGLGSVSLWRDFPERLTAITGCPALLYSRLGHGRSDPADRTRGVDYLHREAVEVLPAVLDNFGIKEPILIGHSDGASIALLYAASGRPTKGVIVEAPHSLVEDVTVAGVRAAVDIWNTTDLPQRMARHHNDAERLFRAWSQIWLDPAFRSWNIESVLGNITAPVLAIQGEDDEYGTPLQVDTVVTRVAGPSEGLLLPNCGHTPHRDQREVVLDAMEHFINRAAGRDTDEAAA